MGFLALHSVPLQMFSFQLFSSHTTFAVVTVILIAGMRWMWIVLVFFLLYILAITEEVLQAHLASEKDLLLSDETKAEACKYFVMIQSC
jgi:hypothetical protein